MSHRAAKRIRKETRFWEKENGMEFNDRLLIVSKTCARTAVNVPMSFRAVTQSAKKFYKKNRQPKAGPISNYGVFRRRIKQWKQ